MRHNFIKRFFVTFFGLMLCGVGISFFLFAGEGVDPASVFQLGISNIFNLTYGNASALMNIVILIIVFFIDHRYISVASLLAIFGIGYTADGVNRVLELLNLQPFNIVTKVFFLLVGLLIMCIGIATYIRAEMGVGAVDLVSELIADKTKIQYRFIRISADLCFVIIGYFMGGKVGVGTLLAAFLTGPVVQVVRPYVEGTVDRFIGHIERGKK